jgi:hypothetical protein
MAHVRVVGVAPGVDLHDATAALWSVPRVGDHLSVCVNGGVEHVEIESVCWPTWGDGGERPDVYLSRPDSMSDEEWAEVFVAINEQRSP